MKSWIPVEVEASQIIDGKFYFITRRDYRLYAARGLNGKFCWSQKQGIACHYEGGDALRREMESKPGLAAVEVPADYKKRWRARKAR